jgi:hypothetical protein
MHHRISLIRAAFLWLYSIRDVLYLCLTADDK